MIALPTFMRRRAQPTAGILSPLPIGIRSQAGFRSTLFVAFSGLYEKFGWVRRFHTMRFPSLNVSNDKNDWYTTGCDGVDSDVAMLEILREYIRYHHHDRLIVVGQSMGGYAALKYGPSLGANLILAFCPQTHFMTGDSPAGKNLLRIPACATDVRPTLGESKIQIELFVSRSEQNNPPHKYFWDDFGHLDGLKDVDHVRTHVVADDDHRVTLHLARSGQMGAILESMANLAQGKPAVVDLDAL